MSINDSNQSTLKDPAHDAGHISGGEWFSARRRKNGRRATDFVIDSTIGNRDERPAPPAPAQLRGALAFERHLSSRRHTSPMH
jgi:hypothetical protein